ncbi:MAG TPA: hypothetical protein VF621_20235, partial [Pyrinomonadaceae bacterium]
MRRPLRRLVRLALALAVALGAAAPARPRPGPGGAAAARFFPAKDLMRVGVYYYPEHWPEPRWDRDFGNMEK